MINLHRSNRLEELFSVLSEKIQKAPAGGSPFDPETIVVQSRSMEDWLKMELSRHQGICANIEFPFPNPLVKQVYEAIDGRSEDAKWPSQGQLAWRLVERIDKDIDQPVYKSIASYLDDDDSGVKRFQLAKKIAYLFDQYSHFRPEMVTKWDTTPLDDWQAALWNSTISASGIAHPAIMARRIQEAIKSDTIDLEKLPRRISLFGIHSLSPLYLEIIETLSEHIEVHLFLLSPCREYPLDTSGGAQPESTANGQSEDSGAIASGTSNSLLFSLGRLGREFQLLLEKNQQYENSGPDLFGDPSEKTALATLQSDLLNLRNRGREKGDTPPQKIREDDNSVCIHSCHSPMREVEVLHDQLLDLLEKDSSLEPRDIVVMLPSLATYAPYIEAVFGARQEDKPSLPFSISDVSAQDKAPVVEAFLRVLELGSTRTTVEEVLGILDSAAVRDRFGLSTKNIDTIEDWIAESGIRWGIDAEHRKKLDQPAFDNNSWRFGLDRMLLGATLPSGETGLWEGWLPCKITEGTASSLLGNLSWYCETLFDLCRDLGQLHTPAQWQELLLRILKELCSAGGEYSQQHQVVRNAIYKLGNHAREAGFDKKVSLDIIRSFFSDRLQKLKTSPGRMGRGITFCSMVPMRSIPFRVICLMGMNDSDYPKPARTPGFDLLQKYPETGDRTLREEDRYCFLEALLSARDKLLITYCGQGIRDNKKLPPSVVISELLDTLDEGFDHPDNNTGGGKSRQRWITLHPLQPFSPAYFDPESPGLFSYAHGYYKGAQALRLAPGQQEPFFNSPLDVQSNEDGFLRLDNFLRFFNSPGAAFLRDRLNIYLGYQEEGIDEREPIELSPLELYKVGNAMLEQFIAGQTREEISRFFKASGQIPPGTPGDCVVWELSRELKPVTPTIRSFRKEDQLPPLTFDLRIGPHHLKGALSGIYPRGMLRYGYERYKEIKLLRLWIEHLVLCSCGPGEEYPRSSMLICRKPKGKGSGMQTHEFLEVQAEEAKKLLKTLLELYEIGQNEPLLLLPRSSDAYLQTLKQGKKKAETEAELKELSRKALQRARREWEESSLFEEAERDEEVFSVLFREADPLHEDYPGKCELQGEENRFEELVEKIFSPLQEYLGKNK